MGPGYPGATRADGTAPSGYVQLLEARLGAYGSVQEEEAAQEEEDAF